jgi:hypothetical protein
MLYREFVLRSPAAWQALAQLGAANAKAFLDRGRPLRVIVTEDEKKRTSEANRFYWGAVLTTIAEQAWVDGRQYSKDVWHEHFARLYLPHTEIVTPYGEIVSRRKSTTELTVSEFSEYLQRVQSDAASSLGVIFD